MNYQVWMQNSDNMALHSNSACNMASNGLAQYMAAHSLGAMRNASPQVQKADRARAYAAEVRARNPQMQVKRREAV